MSEGQETLPPAGPMEEIQQRILVFLRTSQDLLGAINILLRERNQLKQELEDVKEELAKLKIEIKQMVPSGGPKKGKRSRKKAPA